jgi:hypothetical protein
LIARGLWGLRRAFRSETIPAGLKHRQRETAVDDELIGPLHERAQSLLDLVAAELHDQRLQDRAVAFQDDWRFVKLSLV